MRKTKSAAKAKAQKPYIMHSALTDSWFIVTKWVMRRGMCALGPDAGKEFDYLIAKEKFDCTDQMRDILTSAAAVSADR